MIRICRYVAVLITGLLMFNLLLKPIYATSETYVVDSNDNSSNFRLLLNQYSLMGDYYLVDLNNNGVEDLVVNTYEPYGIYSGTVYIITDDILQIASARGRKIDLQQSSDYFLKIDGVNANYSLVSYYVADMDNDSNHRMDLVLSATGDNTNGNRSGSVFILSNQRINQFTGTGNVINMSDPANYILRINGAQADFQASSYKPMDLDGNGKQDLLINCAGTGYGGFQYTGSVYIIYDDLLSTYISSGMTITLGGLSNSAFNTRIDGATYNEMIIASGTIDYDKDNKPDLILSSVSYPSNAYQGKLNMISDTLLANNRTNFSILSLSNASHYTVQISGDPSYGISSFGGGVKYLDYNNDGVGDLIVSARIASPGGITRAGAIYFIDNSLWQTYINAGGTVTVQNSSNYSLRLLGNATNARIGTQFYLIDFWGTGKKDLIFSTYNESALPLSNAGSIIIIKEDTWKPLLGTSQTIDQSMYEVRYDGGVAGMGWGNGSGITDTLSVRDFNNDGLQDFMTFVPGNAADTFAGGLYVILNYPHVISTLQSRIDTEINTTPLTGEIMIPVQGAVDAHDSLTTISRVQYSLDNTNTWVDCVSIDGTFDSTLESYTCNVPISDRNTHTITLRTLDQSDVSTSVMRQPKVTLAFTGIRPTLPSTGKSIIYPLMILGILAIGSLTIKYKRKRKNSITISV